MKLYYSLVFQMKASEIYNALKRFNQTPLKIDVMCYSFG